MAMPGCAYRHRAVVGCGGVAIGDRTAQQRIGQFPCDALAAPVMTAALSRNCIDMIRVASAESAEG